MTTTNWIFANVCYFILFIVDFPAYVVDNWTCEDTYIPIGSIAAVTTSNYDRPFKNDTGV